MESLDSPSATMVRVSVSIQLAELTFEGAEQLAAVRTQRETEAEVAAHAVGEHERRVAELNLAHAALAEQLAGERTQREAEAEAAAHAAEEQERRFSELNLANGAFTKQLADEHKRRETEAKETARAESERRRQLASLGARIAKVETERDRLIAVNKADRALKDMRDVEVQFLGEEAATTRAALVVAEASLGQFASDLNVLEAGIEETLRTAGMRTDLIIAAEQARVNDEMHRREKAEALIVEMTASAETDQARIQALADELAHVKSKLAELRASKSWRLTAPIRQSATWLGVRSD